MAATTNKQIEKACASFEESIKKLIRQHNKYPSNCRELENECEGYVRHANHILRTLVCKRASLEYALVAFQESSKHYVQEFSKLNQNQGDRQRNILTKWFTHFLRVRDGFQLLESGERRHEHDDDVNGAGAKFKSRLSGALRKDGVTRKFKSTLGYTGFGWDEFYDDDVGIRKHLLDALHELTGKSRTAENIISIWEEKMDQHENERKSLNQQLAVIQKDFVTSMNQLLASRGESKLTLVTDDKFERMGWGLLDIKRSGNKFAISDPGGSLPIGMTLSDWRNKFSLEPKKPVGKSSVSSKTWSNPSRKRRVIDDSSDEDDIDEESSKTQQSTKRPQSTNQDSFHGVEVRIREATDVLASVNLVASGQSSSVDEIKRQLGVSARQLEDSRHQLDSENRASSMAACNDELNEVFGDVFDSDEKKILNACIHQWKKTHAYIPLEYSMVELNEELKENLVRWTSEVQHYSRLVRDVVNGTVDKESDEVYAARENFRESNMMLGILLLEIHDAISDHLHHLRHKKMKASLASLITSLSESDYLFLKAAEKVFRKALALVTEQISCPLSTTSATLSIEKHWEKGQHFLLRGRAQTNIGISLLELAHCENDAVVQRHLLSNAMSMFSDAMNSASKMIHNTVIIQNHPNSNDVTRDGTKWKENATAQNVEATKLSAHAGHQCGMCLWNLNRFDEAESKIIQAATTSAVTDLEGCKGVTHLQLFELLCNAYHDVLSLAELSAQSLKTTPAKSTSMGEKFLGIARRAIQRAIENSDAITAFAERHSIVDNEDFSVLGRDVAKTESLKAEEKALVDLWKTKVNSIHNSKDSGPICGELSVTYNIVNRGELQLDLQGKALPADQKRILILEGNSSKRRKQYWRKSIASRRAATETFHSEFVDSTGADVLASQTENHTYNSQYLPWGDDRISEKDRNKYPACCPPLPLDMPLDVRRAIEMKLGDIINKQEEHCSNERYIAD